MNIADFGGFAGIAKMITQIKETSKKLIELSELTGVREIVDFKMKYLDALDKFRPGNTEGVASIAGDFEKDCVGVISALRLKIKDTTQLAAAEKTFGECTSIVGHMLDTVVKALRKAS